ncbi:tetratricopeptide repeat protein [Parafrankia sp. FMc2]|uniref:tetratricopeptide repeat protein n=1 Tax=Parafrankia sp. FMc2 TaxID=3233196 RepID=UPI0034D72E95
MTQARSRPGPHPASPPPDTTARPDVTAGPGRAGDTERSHDPLAVALGNASLLGVGYLMLGRVHLALVSVLITVELLIIFASSAQVLWFAVVVLVWWAALVAHGWYLAGGWPRHRTAGPRRPRVHRSRVHRSWLHRSWLRRSLALVSVLPVLLAFVLLRVDTRQIKKDLASARAAGDCPRAQAVVDRVNPAHRMVTISPAAQGERTVEACARLRAAAGHLDGARLGDTGELEAGFAALSAVLADLPGHENVVRANLDRFLDGLPAPDPCDTASITTWLAQRPASGNDLDRAAAAVPRLAPAALVGCGDKLLQAGNPNGAQATFQQLLDRYPGDALAPRAREGIARIGREAEVTNLRNLLRAPSTGILPQYCAAPVPFSQASGGPNRALVFGASTYVDDLPGEWKAGDLTAATRVLCVGDDQLGSAVETCLYNPGGNVTFHRVALPVRVYELRTGALLTDTRVEISGSSCPLTLYGYDRERYVTPAGSDIQAAFRPLISP